MSQFLDDEQPMNPTEMKLSEKGRVRSRGNIERGDTTPVAWCSQHQEHPSDCFDLHYPNANRGPS